VQIEGVSQEPPALRLDVEGHMPDGRRAVERSLLFAQGARVFHVAALGGAPSADALETFLGSIKPAR
jgi:hypothetical protein